MKKGTFFPWPYLVLCLFTIGCSSMCSKGHEAMTAEEVVEAYLDTALNMSSPSQKEDLMEYTTGELEASLAGASDETVMAAYIKPRYELKRFSLVERKDRTPRETEITFQLTYKELSPESEKKEDSAEVTTENTVAVIREKGKWLIREVMGAKTSFDFPVSDLSRITASPARQ